MIMLNLLYNIHIEVETMFKNPKYKNKEDINKDDVYQWYIVEDNSYSDAPKHFGVSQWTFDQLCKQWGFKKDRHKTCLKSVKTREYKAGGKEEYNKQLNITREKTYIEKYGSIDNFYKQKSLKNKQTWKDNHQDILNKIYETKKKNNSFNSSSYEEVFYNYLLQKYDKDDILREYTDERYPFKCDFYIKSKDLFIELNIHWTHGGKHFDKDNPQDIMILSKWKEKAKNSKFFQNAVHVWSVRDVNKYEIALKNNLNYITIYDWRDINEL